MIEIILLVSSILFIFALKLFGRPSTAHRANTFAMLAMALAVFSAFNFDFSKYDSAFYITIVVSGLLGVLISKRVQMTHCLLYTSPSPRDVEESRMPSSA